MSAEFKSYAKFTPCDVYNCIFQVLQISAVWCTKRKSLLMFCLHASGYFPRGGLFYQRRPWAAHGYCVQNTLQVAVIFPALPSLTLLCTSSDGSFTKRNAWKTKRPKITVLSQPKKPHADVYIIAEAQEHTDHSHRTSSTPLRILTNQFSEDGTYLLAIPSTFCLCSFSGGGISLLLHDRGYERFGRRQTPREAYWVVGTEKKMPWSEFPMWWPCIRKFRGRQTPESSGQT